MRKIIYNFKWLIILAGLGILISGCGNGSSNNNSSTRTIVTRVSANDQLTEITTGVTLDLAGYSGKQVDTLIAEEPAFKPNGSLSKYSYTLTTTASATDATVSGLSSKVTSSFKSSRIASRFAGQAEWDQQMRKKENTMLAGRARQLTANRVSKALLSSSSMAVGSTWNGVYVAGSNGDYQTISATCRYVSNHAYIFVDNNDTGTMNAYVAAYGTAFDRIYNKNHTYFGTENDVDKNGHVIIVFSDQLINYSSNLLGYFSCADKYTYNAKTNPYSNQGDIIYLTTEPSCQGDVIKGTLAHEFQHMIYFDQHYNNGLEPTYIWLDEALSQAAEYYSGYTTNHLAWIADFLSGGYRGLSLTAWTDDNYGYGAIFIRYLIDRYGTTVTRKLCCTGNDGVQAVEAATQTDFNTVFTNFGRAVVLLGRGTVSPNPDYRFPSLSVSSPLQPYKIPVAGATVDGSLKPYELVYYKWSGTLATMNLNGSSIIGTVFALAP